MEMKYHQDGTVCLEGTKSVPEDFVSCCDDFAAHLDSCQYDVRYEWWKIEKYWVIAIADCVGGGGIKITFCPHCGKKL